jgi:tRNA-dihydrouridine synthase A
MYFEKISVAPMLDWTDRHYRYFMRLISQRTVLYTEMIVADAIIHGQRDKLLEFNQDEQHVVLQLGGSNPEKLSQAAIIAKEYGYTEFNLNCGCPSDKVQVGNFGASLMSDPILVGECINAINEATGLPATLKHRIGLDYEYRYDFVANFVHHLSENTNCKKFIVHARNAILKGLSPKQNRDVPPLKYDYVYQLKQDFPNLHIVMNGGIKTTNDIDTHLSQVDGAMLGREAYYNPYLFADFDQRYFGSSKPIKTRFEVATQMAPYLENILENQGKLHYATRHMIGLYHGCKHAKLWRQTLTTKLIHNNSIDEYKELVNYMVE